MSNGNWLNTGFDGLKKEQARLDTMYGPNRFWMPSGSKKQIVLVDEAPAALYEHNPKINGDWKNWFSCLNGINDDVPCCEILQRDYSRYYVGYFTVIDCTEWVDKKGNKYQYELKLFPAKVKTLKLLQMLLTDRRSEGQELAGHLISVSRVDDKSPSCGDVFNVVRKVEMDKLFALANFKGKKLPELWAKAAASPEGMDRVKHNFQVEVAADGSPLPKIVPFNYASVLAPKSPREIRDLLRGIKFDAKGKGESGDDEPTGPSGADTSVPF